MIHNIYLSTNFESVSDDAKYIGSAETITAAWQEINAYFSENGIKSDKWCRYALGENATTIDFGSWSKFIVIEPPFSMADLNQ